MSEFQFFLPIAKVDKERRTVSGYASTPTRDSDGEVVTLEAIRDALPGYMEYGNIREMHALKAVGVAQEANVDTKGLFLTAKIVDDSAWKKCLEGVYKGFSIGGKKIDKDGNHITAIDLTEISVVDRPANPDCRITLSKSEKDAAGTEGHLVKIKAPKSKQAKAIAKLANVMELLAKADNPPAAHDGFSLPAKTTKKAEGEDNPSPKDISEQNNKAEGGDDVEAVEKAKETAAAKAAEDEKKKKKKRKKAEAAGEMAEKLQKALLGTEDYVLTLQRPKLRKSMQTAGSLAYTFDTIRNAQRSLMMEGQREGGDKEDQKLAKELGRLAKDLAGIISLKAQHEGEEALTLTDADDKYISSILGEDRSLQMSKVNEVEDNGRVEQTGDPIQDALAKLFKRAGEPTKAARLTMAKADTEKARKAMKECRKAIEEAHEMHKAAYVAKMQKAAKGKKPEADDDEDGFDHLKCMEKLKKAHSMAESARDLGKAAVAQLSKAESIPGRSGQRGQQPTDTESPYFEVPAGVRELTPMDMATAGPGGDQRGTVAPPMSSDGSVFPGKASGGGDDLRKFADSNGRVPANVMALLLEKAKSDGELEALRRVPARTGNGRPFAFDITKAVNGGQGTNASDLNKTLFEGVDVGAIGSGDERAHAAASARALGNYITSGKFGKSVFDPGFNGTAGLGRGD